MEGKRMVESGEKRERKKNELEKGRDAVLGFFNRVSLL